MLKISTLLPNINDVRAAADRIQSHIIRTPLLESPHLNAIIGGRLLVKAEPLQRTGSFKIRGAFNTLLQLSEAERVNGVLAYSSGNHAQGVACAAQTLGIKATILMPEDAPKVKTTAICKITLKESLILFGLKSAKLSAQSPPCNKKASPFETASSCFLRVRVSPANTNGGYFDRVRSTSLNSLLLG